MYCNTMADQKSNTAYYVIGGVIIAVIAAYYYFFVYEPAHLVGSALKSAGAAITTAAHQSKASTQL